MEALHEHGLALAHLQCRHTIDGSRSTARAMSAFGWTGVDARETKSGLVRSSCAMSIGSRKLASLVGRKSLNTVWIFALFLVEGKKGKGVLVFPFSSISKKGILQ